MSVTCNERNNGCGKSIMQNRYGKKRKNKTFFDRGRFSLDKGPFNG
jgi:hypothetical protein